MKMKYIKPTIKEVNIITHDLCAASSCSKIDIQLHEIKEEKKTFLLKKGETKDMWDSKF